jgi:hypothetical protein
VKNVFGQKCYKTIVEGRFGLVCVSAKSRKLVFIAKAKDINLLETVRLLPWGAKHLKIGIN